jgi:hypothetical protein
MGLDKSACANQSQKLLDDEQTGSYSESEGSLWKVATSLSTCLCSGVLGDVRVEESAVCCRRSLAVL